MEKRQFTNISLLEPEILSLRAAGKTRREIAAHFGLEKKQIMWWVSRYNRRQGELIKGKVPRSKGRPRKDGQATEESETQELTRLRMENRLLRDFLQSTERRCKQK